ncbi:uncharacterized protein LOC125211554 [Salvia hispanica]|uniref:uncharacterized protein LOC125211554 n=1 Tax=Salvia hispanica TaxID=49212 RepID=UPI0020099FAA|nr:uncharacterized protein LOC125211554 [Salvia hispanica]
MEGRRRASQRRSQSKKPPRGYWQPKIPAWEKEFCKVVGSMDWETLLQMKRFMHLYDKVMEWNDSAGEEAFSNAKKRYWANKNGLSCHVSLPDPDLYIDKINWDSDNDPELLLPDVVSLAASPQTEEDQYHDPVVIFGDSAIPDNVFATVGWGDWEENFVAPAACSSTNYLDPWNERGPSGWSGYHNNGWQGYSNDTWQYNNGSRQWGGDWSWNYANHCYSNYVGTDTRDAWGDGRWNDNPTTGFVSQSDSVRAHP